MKIGSLSKKESKMLVRILVAFTLFLAILIPDKIFDLATLTGRHGWLLPFALYFVVYILIGYDVLRKAFINILHGQVFDENFLMCIATLGAFGLAIFRGASGQTVEGFDEACAVLLFYQVGEFFQRYATGKSRKSIAKLMDIRPDSANVLRGGEEIVVDPSEVAVGEIVVINPGERVPLDGVIVKGASSFDTKALTGESLPRDLQEGQEVTSGTVNLTSRIEVRVTRAFYDSTVSKILDLVENASEHKSKAENFITKFARYYTPTVVLVALGLAVLPPVGISIASGVWAWSVFSDWIYRALSFLVVSCPCALVISIPLSFFAGIGAASRYGILVKGSNYLEKFAKTDTFVFDKTGTLTKGNFAVCAVSPESERERILALAAVAEDKSSHPIARSIVQAYTDLGGEIAKGYQRTNVAGQGIIACNGEDTILCGNEKLMAAHGVAFTPTQAVGTAVYVAKNGKFVGSIVVADELKAETKPVLAELSAMGAKTVMLTGDNERIAAAVAKEAGVTEYRSSLLPQNKVEEVEKLLASQGKDGVLCFVGDGINDAPVLMRADVGVAMGGVGSDAAIEASDIVLMHDDLSGIPLAGRIAKKTMRIVSQNIWFSIAVKLAILVLSALGVTNMWIAVFGDVGVAVLAILNAMRVNSKYN